MSLYGMLRTSVSGMAAQSERLGSVADNIANSSTTGYKHTSAEFSSFILDSGSGSYQPGSVETSIRRHVSQQGGFNYTLSVSDLAVKGNGFFVVSGPDGQPVLTRAGSFFEYGDGNLVNAAGFTLLGYPIEGGGGVANGFDGLVPVNIDSFSMQANPTTTGRLYANLPYGADDIAAPDLPAANDPGAQYTATSSMVVYDNVGNPVTLDIYFAKTATADEWEVAVFDRSTAAAGGGFPYTSGPLASGTLEFDAAGQHLSGGPLSIAVPNGQAMSLDFSGSTQLTGDYSVSEVEANGNTPSEVSHAEISSDGIVSVVYENGGRMAAFQIPLATVPSPDNLTALAGNVFAPSMESGDVRIGEPGEGGLGIIEAGALEQSTVDLASELTTMIESQRNYTANSKVFQTGAELLDVLVNLQR